MWLGHKLSIWLNTQKLEFGVLCLLPYQLRISNHAPPKIHVHIRNNIDGHKIIDQDFRAVSTLYSNKLDLYASQEITRVNITPPAAFDFVRALETKRVMSCINCSNCGYPHLDLANFADKPHRKHVCGNCGRDSIWSKTPIVSTPLKPLHDAFAKTLKYETPERTLDLDNYGGYDFTVWASTPAIVWTAARPQEFGIHVHIFNENGRIIDDTFGTVIYHGEPLERAALVESMIKHTIV
jgi:hypothetical protein